MLLPMITRDLSDRFSRAAEKWPAITLTGPRQSGKTTLCRELFPRLAYASLESPDARAYAIEDPRGFLAQFPEGAVLDEIQRVPDLPSYLQGIIDDDPAPGRWILTGSQNLSLLKTVSQSLAGRTAVFNLLPLARGEVLRFPHYPESLDETLLAGTYPRVFDAGLDPEDWFRSYVATYVERDVQSIGNVADLAAFQRFLALCAGRTSQLLNYSSLAGDCGISQPTAKVWLGILETGFLVFRLPGLHTNLRKRLVKMPKLHFYDSGLVCWLLGITTTEQLRGHPLRGAIFESWVISEIVKQKANHGLPNRLSFYRDQNGAEADLIIEQSPGAIIVDAKSSATASTSLLDGARRIQKHLANAMDQCPTAVIYGGDQFQSRGDDMLIPWQSLHKMDWRNSVRN